jgi:hypothetical protein
MRQQHLAAILAVLTIACEDVAPSSSSSPVVASSQTALVTPGSALPLTAPSSPVQAYGRQTSSRLSRGPQGSLITWLDQRTTRTSSLFGARLSPTGQLLDPVGIYLGDSSGPGPAAWDGQQWVIVTSLSTSAGTVAITTRRLAADGTLLDAVPKILAQTSFVFKADPTIACIGTSCLVAWTDRYNTGTDDVLGVRYDASANQAVGS